MELLNVLSGGEFSCIRVFKINEEAWFIGKDICKFFGDTNHNRTISRVDDCDKQYIEIEDSMGRKQNAIAVNESGMYSILFSMQPQKANNGGGTDAYPIEIQQRIEKLKRFKHWVTSEVLPSLRKNGGYIVNQENMTPEQIMAAGLKAAEAIIAQKNKEIERMKPKEIFADAVSASQTSILIGDLAKILKQNGINTGQKRLFEQLRQEGYLIKGGLSRNMPTQRAMEMGLFEVKETTISNPDGSLRVTKTTKVTGKGQQYFVNRYLQPVCG